MTFPRVDGLRALDVNALGPLRIIKALLPNLKLAANPKIVNITSRMASVADNASGGFYGYRASKTALNAITKSLAVDLSPWPVILTSTAGRLAMLSAIFGNCLAESFVRTVELRLK